MVKSKRKKAELREESPIEEIKQQQVSITHEEGGRKVLISKYAKERKDNACRSDKPKNKKVKKTKKRDEQDANKSYQVDQQHLERYFRSESSGQKAETDMGERVKTTCNIHAEIEYVPSEQFVELEREMEETQARDWENIDMFSSKKFSDIMKKHKKFTRYHDTEENEESCIDLQSNRYSKQGLNVVDIVDDEKDILNHHTYQTPANHGQIDYDNEVIPSTFDKIRKVEIKSPSKTSQKSGDLKISDLSSSNKKSIKMSIKNSNPSKQSNSKIFTTSINLLSASPTHSPSDSLTQPPQWNFYPSEDKNLIVDDLQEFKYEDEELEETDSRRIGEGEENRSWGINEEMAGEGDRHYYENVSVFEDDNIPFDVEGEGEKEKDTLKQMRMLFGSEQKIREQSEKAIIQEQVEDIFTPGTIQEGDGGVFDKKSFQEFFYEKFKEMMFENNFSEFMSSVEKTVRENTKDGMTSRTMVEGSPKREKTITPKRRTNFVSPRK